MSKAKKDNSKSISTVARSDDGTVQITFTIPFSDIKRAKDEVVRDNADKVNIPGFRPGKAPLEKVAEGIPENTLLEKTLSKILPQLLTDAIKEHKIKPAIYPKFELINTKEENDWQIRAVTCELPEIDLKNYKKEILSKKKASGIWTPGKDKNEETKDLYRYISDKPLAS